MSKCFAAAVFAAFITSFPAFADNWDREVQTDRMSDKQTIWYGTESVASFDCTRGQSKALLYLTCTPTGFSVLLGTTNCTFSETEVFSYRVDSAKQSLIYATPQKSMTAVHLGSASQKDRANNFVQDILIGNTLLVKVNAVASQSSIAEFSIGGLSAIAGDDFDDCLPN